MKRIGSLMAVSGLAFALCAGMGWSQEKKEKKSEVKKTVEKPGKGLLATFDTSMGKIVCRLFEKESPATVSNFVGLAEGTKEWFDSKTGQKIKKKFYDGLIFHRVIPNFMIQGGCPLGNGTGGPGYSFQDEYNPALKFIKPGMLAMANSGPNTNGSQFFITLVPTPWLERGGNPSCPECMHTIFGEVVEGQEVVAAIGNTQRGPGDKPVTPIVLKKVTIKRAK